MKGTLVKTEQGWVVEYAKHSELPLHPADLGVPSYVGNILGEVQEVEFEIVDYGFAGKYAKLIPSKEQQKQLITEIMEEDVKDGLYDTVNDVEKLADNHVESLGFITFTNDYSNERRTSFIDGYNKAKEETESIFANILDHLCDKMESISQEQIDKDNFQLARYRTFKYIFEYIQSLNKQPIKAKETLYTEERIREALKDSFSKGMIVQTGFDTNEESENMFIDKFIQSLKQPK
jgi:uncharacterized protein YktA (UPF0223 family)